jgi:2-dehydro-3-deoxygluconokinase
MSNDLKIPAEGAFDLISLGALVHRLDPGVIPFRKATSCRIHVSGGEFNVAANLADCFRMNTAIATALVDYPIGDLIAERIRAMGVKPFYKRFAHNASTDPTWPRSTAIVAMACAPLSFSTTGRTKPPRC